MQYLLGQGTEPDTARGIALLEQAAEPEKLSKTSLLGSLLGSPAPVQQGSPDAQRMLGQLYIFGQGVDADWERGIGLYLKAAMQGDGASQAALGIAYEQGLGVQQHLPT
ncbi:MAG: hypothetical protein PHO92_04595, partial [Candidatus Peribacteraceae bacterium]|nr:hypothetical protein [Candidatus Peribacteraceae bacterium]